jgi:hypothetical protein
VRTEAARPESIGFTPWLTGLFHVTASWAGETAQQFGVILSLLMGPAVLCAYAFAVWSLAGNLGWTDTFLFASGPLSNWLIWLGIAVTVNVASGILRRHTQFEKTN